MCVESQREYKWDWYHEHKQQIAFVQDNSNSKKTIYLQLQTGRMIEGIANLYSFGSAESELAVAQRSGQMTH